MHHIERIWHSADQNFQDRFQGEYGRAVFEETIVIIFMLLAHKTLKAKLHPKYHAALDLEWYGSLLPGHPLNGLRKAVQDTVKNWAVEADDHFGSHLQAKFAWLNRQVPRLERYIDSLLAPPPPPRR